MQNLYFKCAKTGKKTGVVCQNAQEFALQRAKTRKNLHQSVPKCARVAPWYAKQSKNVWNGALMVNLKEKVDNSTIMCYNREWKS